MSLTPKILRKHQEYCCDKQTVQIISMNPCNPWRVFIDDNMPKMSHD